jgi:hypothetical protein
VRPSESPFFPLARVGPTTPTRARRLFDASVDPTDARKATVRRFGRSDRPAQQRHRFSRPSIKIRKNEQDKDLGREALLAGHHSANEACQTEPDLAAVIEAWPSILEAIRAGIVTMVEAAKRGGR